MSRSNSFASSVSSRPPSAASSRNATNGSFSSSVGHGRTQSFNSARQPSGGNYGSQSRSGSALPRSRPATAMEVRSPHDEQSAIKDNMGMQFSDSPARQLPSLRIPKLRSSQSMHSIRTNKSFEVRKPSISMAFSRLSVHDDSRGQHAHQVMSSTMGPPPLKGNTPRNSYAFEAFRVCDSEGALVLYNPAEGSPTAPNTPSHLPIKSKVDTSVSIFETPCKKLRKSPSKTALSPFLSKDSNIQNFTAWNVTERLDRMEGMYSNLKSTLECSVTERTTLEQEQSLLKAKGELILFGKMRWLTTKSA